MQIPEPLREALEAEAARFPLAELRRARERLSEAYRAGTPLVRLDAVERVAYALTRMPATYAACMAVLSEAAGLLAEASEPMPITSLLDLGAGSGSMLWAGAKALPSLRVAEALESDAGLAQLGRTLLAEQSGCALLAGARWTVRDMRDGQFAAHDLVSCSYSLGELPERDADEVLAAAWQAATKLLVVIEPGTPAGFMRLRRWRAWLLEAGAYMLAPCPHAHACPIVEGNWCHFAQRVERTSSHRRLKDGRLGHEDEKFSYLIVSRTPIPLPSARIIRHPRNAPGNIHLELCTPDGLGKMIVNRRERTRFRQARHARWGGVWQQAAPDERA